jgi:hypothetical protein
MSSVKQCADKFDENPQLKEAAEEIHLRLMSIEVLEIRRHVYAFARGCAQKNLQRESDENGTSLCSIIGMPLTTEIITEMFCFGFTDSDEQIHANVNPIL